MARPERGEAAAGGRRAETRRETRMSNPKGRTKVEIESWLRTHIAEILGVYLDEVDPETSFPDLGMDSVSALDVTGALENWLGSAIPPTLLTKHDTIRKLATHLGV
jgi:acyl carrier protein